MSVAKVCQGRIVHKGFLVCMVLFCAYVQWSPTTDFDYVWINGHAHYVGAASPHQADNMAVAAVTESIGAVLEDFAPQCQPWLAAQTVIRLAPLTTLRL